VGRWVNYVNLGVNIQPGMGDKMKREKATARKTLNEKIKSIWGAYNKTIDIALKAFDKVVTPARKARNKAIDLAMAEYKKAIRVK